jgi:hypothetical protein
VIMTRLAYVAITRVVSEPMPFKEVPVIKTAVEYSEPYHRDIVSA